MRIVKIFYILFITFSLSTGFAVPSYPRELLLYSFERDPQGWEIPDWAFGKKDHIGKQIGISEFHASEGKYSLELDSEFSGDASWEGAYVERLVEVTDWSPFKYLSLDLFIPPEAPRGFRARIILTVADDWKWTEMNKTVPLSPGEWVVVKVDLTAESMNWRRFVTDDFRKDIRKLGVRIESNGKILYKGPIFIDNVKLSD